MLTNNDPVSFIATRDFAVARAFYENTLGLTLVAEEYFAFVFDLNGHVLRVTQVDEFVPAQHTVLGWNVSDIVETASNLSSNGVVFQRFDGMEQDELGVWVSPSGAKVAWFKDPDGNNLSLTQLNP